MGEGKNSLGPPPAALERKIETIRDDMTGIVSELDRRRHEAFDWRLQLKKHAKVVGLVAGSIFLLLGASVAVGVARRRRHNRPLAKAQRLGSALMRMVDEPEKVARAKPNVVNKTLASAGSAAASILVRILMRRLLSPIGGTPPVSGPSSV